jgi:DNA end-binding protein Ku
MPATVWKGYLSFGLVSFPVRLFAAARAETVHFHMLHKKDESRIKEVWYCIEEDKPVDRGDIVKGYEYRKGKYVVVDDAELKKTAPATATSVDILQFVKSDEVDPIYLEKSYYVAPERAAAKPYALLRKAMQDSSCHAVAKVAMHGREHIVLIRPTDDGLVLHTLYFTRELHKANAGERVSNQKFSAKEVELARRLIDTLAAPFRPEQYKDEYRQNVERLLEQKRKGQKITTVEQPKTAPVVDIMDALRRSMAAPSKKKPAGKRARKAA